MNESIEMLGSINHVFIGIVLNTAIKKWKNTNEKSEAMRLFLKTEIDFKNNVSMDQSSFRSLLIMYMQALY